MSTAFEVTIGATQEDMVNPRETFSRTLTYSENGSAKDLTGATLEVDESYPTAIKSNMTLTITDAANGVATATMTPTQMDDLELGRSNWFRLKLTESDGTVDVTPKIWIHVT